MIPVIDLFAGPGGLGEGFSASRDRSGRPIFKITLSVEKDADAHRTLRLRSFFRQFPRGKEPAAYYEVLRGTRPLDDLYGMYPKESEKTEMEAWNAELGAESFPPELVDSRIKRSLAGRNDFVLIGGPPCQAYSLVGRSRMIPKNRAKYERDHRHFLYREYLRILAVHQPPVFVLENVKGILSSKMDGVRIIDRILSDLREPLKVIPPIQRRTNADLGYELHPLKDEEIGFFGESTWKPADFIIRSEDYEIPQARHRFILLGVRKDLNWSPGRLKLCRDRVDLWMAIKDLPRIRSRVSGTNDSSENWLSAIRELMSRLSGDKVDPPVMQKMQTVAQEMTAVRSSGAEFIEGSRKPAWKPAWFYDGKLAGVCNHSSRSHMKEDLWRYFFAACFASVAGRSPNILDFPELLIPDHRNLDRMGDEDLVFADRFRVQVKQRPASTITSHISKDGHYFIHPDPFQCRSLTVREAARIQTFPDNYYFVGGRTAQYQQVGNAVPPLLARSIAKVVAALFNFA
jgi:DNA (cytosine-5)-methyltransferase 1